MNNPGNIYTVSRGKTGMVGVYRLETQVLPGNGKSLSVLVSVQTVKQRSDQYSI